MTGTEFTENFEEFFLTGEEKKEKRRLEIVRERLLKGWRERRGIKKGKEGGAPQRS